jgi:hypothetical protein
MAGLFKGAERLMGMTETIWLRHANPWSVYSRIPCLPLICLAIWSRIWLGWWAMGPLLLSILWVWVNPRIFPAPKYLNSWASKGCWARECF